MIPWRLQFSGIRDYGVEEMNLENEHDHVIITGPNGTGKSTISFCMGAVLRSSKVDIDGLKSQNLPVDQTWHAQIRFLFKNVGYSRIDAPLYIEFRLYCEQLPKQPIKLRYEIHDGDEIDQLELRQTYRSGDVNKNNYSAYKRELQFKYKIHPDLYYLIWYQQEVNQFAEMVPEERFRIFSEMHGIQKIQKDWETSLEVVKEAQESLAVTTNQQKAYEFNLSVARSAKDRYEANKKRLHENGYLYACMTYQLQIGAEQDQVKMEKYIEERELELDSLIHQQIENEERIALEKDKRKDLIQEQNQKQASRKQQLENLRMNEDRQAEVDTEVNLLQNELSELREAYQKLSYSEEETKEKWLQATEQAEQLRGRDKSLREKITSMNDEMESTRQNQADLKSAIKQWEENSRSAHDLLTRYTSSYKLTEEIALLDDSIQTKKEQLEEKNKQLRTSKKELEMLERNQIESPRQREAIRELKKQGIQAYSFRYFISMIDHVDLKKETLFDTIKYTVFYDGSTCQPVNDLYHVSLKKIIPDRSLTELPQWGLRMREGLSTEDQNKAARVLWWIERFFSKETPRIEHGWLVDQQGMRGAQEQDSYILSKKALENRKQNLEQQIDFLQKELELLKEKVTKENETYQIWNADVQKIKEAEAFLSTKAEQDYRIKQLEQYRILYQQLLEDKTRLEEESQNTWKESHRLSEEVKKLETDLQVYEKFSQQTERIERLQKLEQSLKELKNEIKGLRSSITTLNNELDDVQQHLRTNQRTIDELEDEGTQNKRSIKLISNQKQEKEEERIAMSKVAVGYKEELEELRQLIPDLVEKAATNKQADESKFELQNRQNQAKVEFFTAKNEKDIDPNAVENFYTLEKEVLRKKDELLAAKNLLEENEERAIQNEKRLETAITMQVQRIHLLFEQYMGLFQFEGQIKYEKTLDKKGRPVFKLFIYVRKEGHRGKVWDVSWKARGGRVGKGVSGGEESLSSLLFALSLLQNLENRASFIVMDEFDSALDENRKAKVFELYAEELQRKLIILSPKGHEDEYYNRFSKAFIVSHDPTELRSKVKGIKLNSAKNLV